MEPTEPPDGASTAALTDATYYVLGDDALGVTTAERLHARRGRVAAINDRYQPDIVPGVVGDLTNVDTLATAGIDADSTVVVGTRSDRRNLLVAQLVSAHFDVDRVVVVVNDPDRLECFEAAGHDPFCATTALSTDLARVV